IAYDQHLLDSMLALPNGLTITGQYPATHHTAQVTYNNGTVDAAIGAKYDYDSLALVADRHNLASSDTIINSGRDYSHDASRRLPDPAALLEQRRPPRQRVDERGRHGELRLRWRRPAGAEDPRSNHHALPVRRGQFVRRGRWRRAEHAARRVHLLPRD